MVRRPRLDLEQELRDPEYARLYGAEQAKVEFAVTLARARRGSRVTQKELAGRLGLSQPYIAKLERGDTNPTLGTVGSLLAVLGLRLMIQTEPLLSYPLAGARVSSADAGTVGVEQEGASSYPTEVLFKPAAGAVSGSLIVA